MTTHRRLAHYFLILCLLLGLGDAPYVDEFLADLAQVSAQDSPDCSLSMSNDEGGTAPKSSESFSGVCQNLLNLPGVSQETHVTPGLGRGRPFLSAVDSVLPLAPLDRIDRPPASLA